MKVHKACLPLFSALGIYLFAANAFASNPNVSFAIDNSVPATEASFTVDVLVSGIDNSDQVVAFGFNTAYAASLTLNSVSVGSSFFDNSSLFADTAIAGSVFPVGPNGDNILLAALQFSAATPGVFYFSTASDITNPDQGLLLFNEGNIFDLSLSQVINVSPGSVSLAVIPLPAANLLFASGLLAMGFFRNKFKTA